MWLYDTFANNYYNLGIDNTCTKCLKECGWYYPLANISLLDVSILCFCSHDFTKLEAFLSALSINWKRQLLNRVADIMNEICPTFNGVSV